jgi:excisionase family DNA binding protein
MSKSELLVALAQLPDNDSRLAEVAAALAGRPPPERPSLRLLRMGEAAKETTLSRTTIWRAVRDGVLKAVEVRKGSWRISESELRRFVEGRRS